MGDEREPEAFERGLSAPTSEGPQLGDTAGAGLELDGRQQGACDASAPGSGMNEQHVDQAVWQQVCKAHNSVVHLYDEGGRSPPSDIPTAQVVRQVDPANLDTEVILGSDRSAVLRELLPAHNWPQPLISD